MQFSVKAGTKTKMVDVDELEQCAEPVVETWLEKLGISIDDLEVKVRIGGVPVAPGDPLVDPPYLERSR